MRLILLALIASALCAADVTRADVDAAGKAYATTVIAYYTGLLAKAQKVQPVKIHDDMTGKEMKAARLSNIDADNYEYIVNYMRQAQKDKTVFMVPLRAANLDYNLMEGDRADSVRRILGLPAR